MMNQEKILMFLLDEITQVFMGAWLLWFMTGIRLALRRGDFSMRELLKGIEVCGWCLAAMYISWFILNSPAVLKLGTGTLALAFNGATLGGILLSTYRNVSVLMGRDAKERSWTAEPPLPPVPGKPPLQVVEVSGTSLEG